MVSIRGAGNGIAGWFFNCSFYLYSSQDGTACPYRSSGRRNPTLKRDVFSDSKTRTGVVKGTPYYMAPEQITGKKVDGRCDIFSLGIVLYQLLTGSLPFAAANPGALMSKIVNDPHPDPKSINPKILAPLVDVINKALEKDVTKRYQDAWQMAAHLRIIGNKIDTLLEQRRVSVRVYGN
jgi:serine/threonine protein kinase